MHTPSFTRILCRLTESVSLFIDKIDLLDSYRRILKVPPCRMTPGEEMIFEGKKLRVQELPKELDLLQESIVHAGRRLTELIPELPKRTCYKKADDLFSGPSTLEILIKNTARLATSAQKLERLGKENPYSEEKT